MLREATFDTGQVRLHYVEGPANGTPLVLLHGGSARWQSWEQLLPALLPRNHVFALDLRGHGQSGWRAPYTLQAYAEDIVSLLEQHVGQPATLCGHSLGGMVALLAAGRVPDAVRGLIMADSPLTARSWIGTLQATRPRLEEWHALAARNYSTAQIAAALKTSPVEVPGHEAPLPAWEVMGADSPWFNWMAVNLAQLDPATLGILIDDAQHAARGYGLEKLFSAIRCRTWLLQADPATGALMQSDEIREAQRLNSQVRHHRLAGVSHAMHATHPELIAEALLACIQDIERA